MDNKSVTIVVITALVAVIGLLVGYNYAQATPWTSGYFGPGMMGRGGMMGGGMMGGGMMGGIAPAGQQFGPGMMGVNVTMPWTSSYFGPGMMGRGMMGMMGGSGMMGGGMMGGMMGGAMLVSGGIPYNPDGKLLTLEQAKEIAERYIANNPDLEIYDLEEYEFNFYVSFKEKSTGIGAFETVIDKYTGVLSLEMGPNMMWNTKYGMMGMGGFQAKITVSEEQAKQFAQAFLDSRLPGTSVGEVAPFYGFYHVMVTKDGKNYGMLSINGYTGQAWYHTWHGNFIRELEEK